MKNWSQCFSFVKCCCGFFSICKIDFIKAKIVDWSWFDKFLSSKPFPSEGSFETVETSVSVFFKQKMFWFRVQNKLKICRTKERVHLSLKVEMTKTSKSKWTLFSYHLHTVVLEPRIIYLTFLFILRPWQISSFGACLDWKGIFF